MPSNKRRPHNNEEISEETEDFDMEGKVSFVLKTFKKIKSTIKFFFSFCK